MIPINHDEPCICSICKHHELNHIGNKDFGVSAGDYFEGRRLYPDYDVEIPYYECQNCFFIFTPAFDFWSKKDFETHIYNEDYILADKPFLEERPIRNANLVSALFHRESSEIDVLDFGGGSGLLSIELNRAGFRAETYDVHYANNVKPNKKFDLVTSFEVLEHVPHLGEKALDWWYVSPRNGHISIHSRTSLLLLTKSVGLDLFSANASMHFLTPNNSANQISSH